MCSKANSLTLDFVAVDDVQFRCSECGDPHLLSTLHLCRSSPYSLLCETCFDRDYFICCDCGEAADNDEGTTYGDGQLCESCYSDGYFTCDHCDEISPNGLYAEVDEQSWCRSCRSRDASRCAACGTWTQDENTIGVNHGSLCMSCYEDSYFTCEECDETLHNDDYGENGRCQSCCESSDPDSIMDYHTDVRDVLHPAIPYGVILYGIELEVTTPNDRDTTAHECRESLGDNYCITKHDSSLGGGGFEIVTVPKSLKSHTRIWSDFLDSPPRGLRSWDGGTCGLHVHVSREPLSLLSIGKLLVFINADENKSFVVSIAGRDSTQWAKRLPKKITDARKRSGDRFQAINLCNPDTVEFRIFRGTLKKSSFLKNLEFVVATIAFCQVTGINELGVASFLAWFALNRKDYPNLDAWLVGRGHIKARSKPRKAGSTKGGE